jgi:predicted DNA-binding protein
VEGVKMQQLTIRMPDEDLSRIEKIAKSTGLKKSDITRMAIKKFVEEYNNEKREICTAGHPI